MNDNIFIIVLSVYITQILCVTLKSDVENVSDLDPELPVRSVNSVLYKVVNKFHCSTPNVNDSHLLVFGSKAWSFPPQDVNVTLAYPTEKTRTSSDHFDDYVITGFRVHIYIDGTHSDGYITQGGILKESITLSFVTSNVTILWYQFWLFGVPKNVGIGSSLVAAHNMQIRC